MERLSACMRCGSDRLRNPTLADGLVPGFGEGMKVVCDACGWQGAPLAFDSEADLRAFQAEKRAEGERGEQA